MSGQNLADPNPNLPGESEARTRNRYTLAELICGVAYSVEVTKTGSSPAPRRHVVKGSIVGC